MILGRRHMIVQMQCQKGRGWIPFVLAVGSRDFNVCHVPPLSPDVTSACGVAV